MGRDIDLSSGWASAIPSSRSITARSTALISFFMSYPLLSPVIAAKTRQSNLFAEASLPAVRLCIPSSLLERGQELRHTQIVGVNAQNAAYEGAEDRGNRPVDTIKHAFGPDHIGKNA
jgi:hypothetical protein